MMLVGQGCSRYNSEAIKRGLKLSFYYMFCFDYVHKMNMYLFFFTVSFY